MTRVKRYQRYSSEFKREALLRASEEGMTDTTIGRALAFCPTVVSRIGTHPIRTIQIRKRTLIAR